MVTILGDYVEDPPAEEKEYLAIGFSPSSVPLKQRWRNNGLSADFLADYVTTFFPARDDDPSTVERQENIHGGVGYIANELLENAMKFNYDITNIPINIQLYLHDDHLVFFVRNSLTEERHAKFKAFIQEVLENDPQELYIAHLERTAEEESCGSGLGILTMLNDYAAKIGWKFEQVQTEPLAFTVTARVEIEL